MGIVNQVRSFFRGREKVNVLTSLSLEIIPSTTFSDTKVLPGLSKNPPPNSKIGSRGLTYLNTWKGNREWIIPEYDHAEIELVHDIESYFFRATRAKSHLFIREGYEFVGKNDTYVEYIRLRIRQIERASGIPFIILLSQTGRDLIVHSNAYWLKVRKEEASGGRIRTAGNKKLLPVAGYFRLPPETMLPEIDGNGNITRWKQMIGDQEKIFAIEDIVHFYTNKKGTYPLGVPTAVSFIDDIRALRSLEQNVNLLINKHLFPIILWKVGTPESPARTYADGSSEIDVVQDVVADMPTEGSLVVSERYDVSAVGVKDKALDIRTYLDHYKERLFAGFDVSSIDMGAGSSASRSTAQTLSRNLIDSVKFHQLYTENFIQPIIEELLFESTFPDDSILNQENLVYLKFHEIDKEAKQAAANHSVDLFTKNAITFPEMRLRLDTEVLTPEEEKELHFHKFALPQIQEQAIAKQNNSPENNNNPENQHGKRGSTKLNKDALYTPEDFEENPLLRLHSLLADELQARSVKETFNIALACSDIRTTYERAIKETISVLNYIIRQNYRDPQKAYIISKQIEADTRILINRLRDVIISRIKENNIAPDIIFSAVKYRTVSIFKTQRNKADNLSKYLWLRDHKKNIRIETKDNCCSLCSSKLTVIQWDDKLGEVNIPPFHPLCTCKVIEMER